MDKRLLDVFIQTISIESTSSSEKDIAEFIKSFLRKLELSPFEDTTAFHSNSNCGNVICPIGNGGDTVLLCHMDTARSTKNVKPQMLSDRITSDGTTVLGVDNRAGISCILYAIEKLINERTDLKDITLAFTVQEETTLLGSRNIEIGNNIKMGIVFDSHLRPGNFICQSAGSKGFKIELLGKASHSGLAPENGIDSIKITSLAISKIDFGKLSEDTTANIGIINGGTATNVVPELTIIEGEIRSMVPSEIEKKLTEIRTTFEETSIKHGAKCKFSSDWNFQPYLILSSDPIYQKVERTLRSVGLNPIPNISKGGSDANSLNGRGIKCINIGIGAENPHSNDEFILFEDLIKTSEIAMEFMRK